MLQVDKFFCFASLKTGSLLVGYFSIIFNITTVIMNIYYLSAPEDIKAGVSSGYGDVAIALVGITIIIAILRILAASSLIFGAWKNKSEFVLPALVMMPFGQAWDWIRIFATAIWLYVVSLEAYLIQTPISLLFVYFWVCIFFFWNQMKEESGKNKENLEDIR